MVLGITGGMGSGKSTVTNILYENYCIEVLDGDIISREVIARVDVLKKITENFGEGILNDIGTIDRKNLGRLVFNDKKKLKILNQIMHKAIAFEIEERIRKNKQKTFVVDVALPVKDGFLDVCDEIWCVMASFETRIKRLKVRDAFDEKQIINRIDSQPSDDYYIKIADKVLRNEGSIENLRYAVIRFWEDFMKG